MAEDGGHPIKVGILTVSDSCYHGHQHDKSGDNLKDIIDKGRLHHAFVKVKDIVPDEQDQIKEKLLEWCSSGLDLILTTGGTGFSPRDVTPEATRAVIEKEAPGLSLAMIKGSMDITPFAMLSRPVCGIRKKTLIINLPGSKKASQECLEMVLPGLPHAFDLLRGHHKKVASTHTTLQQSGSQVLKHPPHPTEQLLSRGQHHTPHPPDTSLSRGHHHSSPGHSDERSDNGHGSHHHSGHHHGDKPKDNHKDDHHGNNHHQQHGHHHGDHHHGDHHHGDHHHSHGKSDVDTSHVARRHRTSTFPMISVEEAVACVLAEASRGEAEELSFRECLGRYLAEDVFAKDPLPPFPASIMDGYAVIAADGAGLRAVIGDSTAGSVAQAEVTPGHCIRISTGAPLPPGADAVVKVEDTELVKEADSGGTELEIKILVEPKKGQDIRPVGSDISTGEHILTEGTRLGPAELGLLATIGALKVKCWKKPIVGVMSTGNELMEPGGGLKTGKIRDSNRTTLMALLTEHNYQPVDLGIARDTPEALLKHLKEALKKVDVLVTSGGVSMGEKDLIRDVLCVDLKANVHFGRVCMKPGKPTTLITVDCEGKKKLVLGLPGNPVSATVTCNLYVIPALNQMSGNPNPQRTRIKAKLTQTVRLDPRPEYHRCFLNWPPGEAIPEAISTGNQMSSRLLSMKSANALLLLPPRTDELQVAEKGEIFDAMVIGAL